MYLSCILNSIPPWLFFHSECILYVKIQTVFSAKDASIRNVYIYDQRKGMNVQSSVMWLYLWATLVQQRDVKPVDSLKVSWRCVPAESLVSKRVFTHTIKSVCKRLRSSSHWRWSPRQLANLQLLIFPVWGGTETLTGSGARLQHFQVWFSLSRPGRRADVSSRLTKRRRLWVGPFKEIDLDIELETL